MDTSLFVVDGFIEIKLAIDKAHKGLWKIIEVQNLNDGDEDFFRVKLDRNESVVGDEIWAEYYPSMPKKLCIFTEFEAFKKENAQGWPPPAEIIIDEVEYFTLDPDATDCEHEGFTGINNENEPYQHWEYEDEKAGKLLQVTLVNGYVTMHKGYVINTGFVKLI